MKIALIGNIHDNLPALETVLEHAEAQGVDKIIHAGNTLGYGAFPNETIQKLQEKNVTNILGRRELQVLKVQTRQNKIRTSNSPDEWLFDDWLYKALSVESREYLSKLRLNLKLRLKSGRIFITHKLPFATWDDNPQTLEALFPDIARRENTPIIIYSHSDIPTAKKVDQVWFINTGSIASPEKGESTANYQILQINPDSCQIRPYQISYDMDKMLVAIREHTPDFAPAKALPALNRVKPFYPVGSENRKIQLDKARYLTQYCCSNHTNAWEHSRQVTRLALALFDALRPLHQLEAEERYWLECGALLHEIGWIAGVQTHHKTAFNIILHSAFLPFSNRERWIIGLLARSHRKTSPQAHQLQSAALEPSDHRIILLLTAILKVADGLDSSYQSTVSDVKCIVKPEHIEVICNFQQNMNEQEIQSAREKGRFFEKVYRRKLVIHGIST